jgi:HK97 gp10 family phage protein
MTIIFDTKEIEKKISLLNFSISEFSQIEQAGAEVLKTGMRQRAPRDTGELIEKIQSHIVEASNEKIEDDIGSDAPHAVYQEYGTGIYAENGQGRKTPWVYKRKDGGFITTSGNRPHPFIRPTVREDYRKTIDAMQKEFSGRVNNKWK